MEVRELVEKWVMYRDSADWENFRTVWTDDGRMMATWFHGPAEEFIKVSIEGFERGIYILHFLGGSMVDIEGGGGPMGLFNVVKISDKSGQERVIFHSPDTLLGTLRFIDGGSQLVILLHKPVDPNIPFENTWVALDRQGNVSELQVDGEFSDIFDAPGGYALFSRDMEAATGRSTFSLERHFLTDQELSILWNSDDGGWELVWASPALLGSNLIPFPAFVP